MRFFVINLDRDPSRLTYMMQELHQRGCEAERIRAFNGLDIPEHIKPYLLTPEGDIASAMTKGEVGCYASHLSIMHCILSENITEPVCVLEDDLRFEGNFVGLQEAMTALPADWDILRISNPTKADCSLKGTIDGFGKLVKYWRVPNTTGAYVINQRGARKFLQYQTLRQRPIDEDMRRVWEHGMVTYGILPSPTTPNIFDSTIDRIGGERALPGRKRFRQAENKLAKEWAYRLREFGLLGCLKAMINTNLLKKRTIKAWNRRN